MKKSLHAFDAFALNQVDMFNTKAGNGTGDGETSDGTAHVPPREGPVGGNNSNSARFAPTT